jgi:purine-cytosine permease-like protein
VVALVVIAALTIVAGVAGFGLIMRLQTAITVITAVLTIGYMALVADKIHWSTVSALPDGSAQQFIGTLVFFMTGFGLGWVNAAADYSRYLPRDSSGPAVVGWTAFGSSLAPIVLLVFGLLLAAALIDGLLMVAGTIYVVFVADNFLGQFIGFLLTLGVPIAAWCGIMLADIALRRRDYAEADLYRPSGRFGDIRLLPLAVVVVSTALGWGLVTNALASWLTWQGYLLSPFGLGGKTGSWAAANLGVLVALAIGFVVTLVFGRRHIRAQEAVGVR